MTATRNDTKQSREITDRSSPLIPETPEKDKKQLNEKKNTQNH